MIDRRDYAALYGPTTGDAVRLGDTSLVAVVEKDHAVYGALHALDGLLILGIAAYLYFWSRRRES